jgi:tetratricopeptide (TPR) repeat protein
LFLILILFFCFCDVFVLADFGVFDRRPRLKTIFDCPIRLSPLEKPFAIIPAHTIVVEERRENVNGISWVWVSVPPIIDFGTPLVGWMKADDLRELTLQVENDFKKNEAEQWLSEYIKELSKINKLCQENEKRSKNERLPEPYFARAKLYEQNGEYANAMTDYLEGLSYVQNQFPSGYQYVPYEKYFDEIKCSVENALNRPCAVTRLGRQEIDVVGRCFSQGYTYFWKGQFTKALCYFDKAINIHGNVPIYWYYRGLTYWKLCNKKKATYNLLMASAMEKNIRAASLDKNHWANKYPLQLDVSEYLTRFQGNDRMFLENIRWGDSSNLILKTFLDETQTRKK